MKRLLTLIVAIGALMVGRAWAQGPNDVNAGSTLTSSGSAYAFSWWGVSGNTYLVETSDDLVNWSYVPIVESGTGGIIEWGIDSNASALFMKLEYITVPASELAGTAFDGPLDSNGLPGDWELFFFGQLGMDTSFDPNGEGLTVMEDYENGNNPIATQVVSAEPFCVGEYLFHETSGTVAYDISSLHNDGVLSGGASWEPSGGYDGQGAISFDGTSGEVVVSDSANQVLPISGAPFSLSFWFDANSGLTGTTTLITNEVTGSSGFELGIDSTTSPPSLLLSITGSSGTQMEAPIQSGSWTQAALSYDGTTATVYVDGFEAASGTGTLLSNTNSIALANGLAAAEPFAGAMENLTLYQAVLAPSDALSLYNISTTSTGPDPSTLPNWWKYQYFGTLSADPNAYVGWSGSQMTLLEAYEEGLNPIDFYNGQPPTLAIVSGSSQVGPPGGFVPLPLVVSVTDSNGNPIDNAPVTFAAASGGGLLQASGTVPPLGTLTLFANGSGNAQVYFQLPNVENNTSQITATTGSGSTFGQVTFAEASDSGTGVFAAAMAASNCTGVLNTDGSITLTWVNTISNALYILVDQQQTGGGWSAVSGTLPSNTTSYTISSPSGSGPYRVDTFTSGSGGSVSDNPSPTVYLSFAQLNYALVDLTGSAATISGTSYPVQYMQMDDYGNSAFQFTTGSNAMVCTWASGILHGPEVFPFSDPGEITTPVTSGSQVDYLNFTMLAPNGVGYGWDFGQVVVSGTVTSGWANGAQFSGNSFQDTWPPNPPYGSYPSPSEPSATGDSAYATDADSNGWCGEAAGQWVNSSGTNYSVGGIVVHSGTTIFDPVVAESGPSCPGIQVIDTYFIPYMINSIGSAAGYGTGPTALLWTGTGTPSSLSPMEAPIAINDINQVIGVAGTSNYLESNGSIYNIAQLLPAPAQNQLQWMYLMDISGTNSNGSVGIYFNAAFSIDPQGDAYTGPFLLTLTTGTNPAVTSGSNSNTLQQLNLPSAASFSGIGGMSPTLNAQGILSGPGWITTGGSTSEMKALALTPITFQQTAPSSGFDWVSQPHWLMVPLSSTNQAIAVTAASSNLPFSFSVQPNPSPKEWRFPRPAHRRRT